MDKIAYFNDLVYIKQSFFYNLIKNKIELIIAAVQTLFFNLNTKQ